MKSRLLVDSGVSALGPGIWGSTYLITTELLPDDRPLMAATTRALPAGLALLCLGGVRMSRMWALRTFILGVLNIGAFFYLLFLAAYHLPGGVAALIQSIQPTLVLVLAAVLLRDRIKGMHVFTCLLGIAGVALLVLQPDAGLDATGVLAAVGGALCMACGIVLTKRWGRPPGMGVLVFTGWQLTVGGLVLLPFMAGFEGFPSTLTGKNITGFVYLIIFGSLFGYAVWFRGIERLPALAVSFLSFASPVVATILGYIFLDQTLSAVQIVGALVIIGAVVLAQPRPQRRRQQPPEEAGEGTVLRSVAAGPDAERAEPDGGPAGESEPIDRVNGERAS